MSDFCRELRAGLDTLGRTAEAQGKPPMGQEAVTARIGRLAYLVDASAHAERSADTLAERVAAIVGRNFADAELLEERPACCPALLKVMHKAGVGREHRVALARAVGPGGVEPDEVADPPGGCAPPSDLAAQMISEVTAEDDLRREAESIGTEAAAWSNVVLGRRGNALSATFRDWVVGRMRPGTFSTPLASCIHHRRKHTRAPGDKHPRPAGEPKLREYVAESLARGASREKMRAREWAYQVPSLAAPDVFSRTINHPDFYVVTTEESPNRLMSFRDRRRLPA